MLFVLWDPLFRVSKAFFAVFTLELSLIWMTCYFYWREERVVLWLSFMIAWVLDFSLRDFSHRRPSLSLSLFQSFFSRSWLSSSTTVCFDEKWVLEFYSFFLTSFFSCRNLSLDFLFLLFVIHRQSCIPLVENLLILLLQQDCRVRSKNV